MNDRLQSWWDVNSFTICTLRPPSITLVGVSAAVLIAGGVLWIGDLISGAWVAVIVGLLGLGKDAFSLTIRWFTSPHASLKADDRYPQLLLSLRLTPDYEDQGYQIVAVPYRLNEYVVRSSAVDSFLRCHDVTLQENQELLNPITEKLRRNSEILEDTLRCQYRQSWRADPPRRFVNEAKACLGQDLFPSQEAIWIYQGSYFHSFLTNELVTRILESGGSRPMILYRGSEHFPRIQRSQPALAEACL